MKNILIVGSTGQIGSELTMYLRNLYGNEHVVAGYITGAEPKGELLESGPSAIADVIDAQMNIGTGDLTDNELPTPPATP